MTVDIDINGVKFWDASDYAAQEDATPIDPSDTSAAVAQFTVTVPQIGDYKGHRGKTLTLTDSDYGKTVGTVISLAGDKILSKRTGHVSGPKSQGSSKAAGTATLTVNSPLAALNTTRTAQPYTGTLEGAFTYYLSLVGLTSGIVIDKGIINKAVAFPGWKGIVWDQVKALMAAQQVETAVVGSSVVLRPLRTRVASNFKDSVEAWNIDVQNIAQTVEVYYYQSQQQTNYPCYPLGGWTQSLQAYQVDAGATVQFTVDLQPQTNGKTVAEQTLGASLSGVVQPSCVASVAESYSGSSVYTVAGNDGLPITPSQWTATGGSVTVAIGPDTRSLIITITGSNLAQYAPYTIGMSSGSNTYYSSLRLTGTGVFYDREKITFQTGNSPDVAATVVGATVDNPFIQTVDDAYRAGLWAAAKWTGPQSTITVTTDGINQQGDSGSLGMTMGDFNADPDFIGLTNTQFNSKFSGLTMGQFNALQDTKTASKFGFQAFGNVAGSRVYADGSWFRINQVTNLSPLGVQYTAEADNTLGDFNSAYAGLTMAQFNALHTGQTNGDFNTTPLEAAGTD